MKNQNSRANSFSLKALLPNLLNAKTPSKQANFLSFNRSPAHIYITCMYEHAAMAITMCINYHNAFNW